MVGRETKRNIALYFETEHNSHESYDARAVTGYDHAAACYCHEQRVPEYNVTGVRGGRGGNEQVLNIGRRRDVCARTGERGLGITLFRGPGGQSERSC